MGEKKNRNGILSSTFLKIIVFFLLAVSFTVGVLGGIGTIFLWEGDVYRQGVAELIRIKMENQGRGDLYDLEELFLTGETKALEEALEDSNLSLEIFANDSKLWGNYDGTPTPYSFVLYTENRILLNNTSLLSDEEKVAEELVYRFYVDDTFPVQDRYLEIYNNLIWLEDYIYVLPSAAAGGIFLFLCCFVFLMCAAGHHRGQEGVTGGVLSVFYFDLLSVVFGAVALFTLIVLTDMAETLLIIPLLLFESVWVTVYCMEFALQLKKGTLFQHTFVWVCCRFARRICRRAGREIVSVVRGFPGMLNVVLFYGAFCAAEIVAMIIFAELWEMRDVVKMMFLWLGEKALVFGVLLHVSLLCRKIQQGSEALAEGNLSYKLDTSRMLPGFREHAENLNRIGEGMSHALEERMKSERLKTELITNVSHDLKTPLTSIINYADLIGAAVTQKQDVSFLHTESGAKEGDCGDRVAEYAEVLQRQSGRLKKLLEDLVEASKAATGNIEINPAACEIGVILSQAAGEYEKRLSDRGLELIVRQTEEPVKILADGRHLWRVFDNLMNNICKYAQENTRVYLTVERREKQAEIIFRNMSKYPLEMSADELKERFARGDRSRHMEGNGLGLSIAASLTELQNGEMEVVTDGDLFKVILRFDVLE